MTTPDMTDAELEALTERTQAYIDKLHDFAQMEAEKADIPVSVAIPAVLGWAVSIAKIAGIKLMPLAMDLEAAPTDPNRLH
jgi:hypothetical protein